MIILDENILEGQRLLLERGSQAIRQIGFDAGRKGLSDEEAITLLLRLRQPTFVTRDLGFYRVGLCHRHYCIVVAAVGQYETAAFVRRFLRHPGFDTQAERGGKIVRLSPAGITFWQLHRHQETFIGWQDRI